MGGYRVMRQRNINILLLMSLFFAILSVLFSLLGIETLTLFITYVAFLLLLLASYRQNDGKVSLITVFLLFFMLYSLSGPTAVLVFNDFGANFGAPYHIDAFLIIVNMIIASYSFILMVSKPRFSELSVGIYSKSEMSYLKVLSSILIILSIAFDGINIVRVGGLSALFVGKALYQSKVADLTLTLPSFEIYSIGFIFAAYYLLSKYKNNIPFRKDLVVFAVLSFPIIAHQLVIGSRGGVVRLGLILLSQISAFVHIRIKPKYVLGALGGVMLFSVLLSYQARIALTESIIQQNPSIYLATLSDRDVARDALNFGKNEFGVAFGNFNEYYKKYQHAEGYTNTVISSLLVPVPSWMLPFDKPQQIVYQFRDEFFPSRALYGRVSSTGFSATLEGYINAGFFGAICYYLFILFGLLVIEKSFFAKRSRIRLVMYYTHIIFAQKIHRMSFGDYLGDMATLLFSFLVMSVLAKGLLIVKGALGHERTENPHSGVQVEKEWTA